jgi:hypothetical protein
VSAVQVLHDEIVDPILGTDIMEGADVRMIQRGNRAGFGLEALA